MPGRVYGNSADTHGDADPYEDYEFLGCEESSQHGSVMAIARSHPIVFADAPIGAGSPPWTRRPGECSYTAAVYYVSMRRGGGATECDETGPGGDQFGAPGMTMPIWLRYSKMFTSP